MATTFTTKRLVQFADTDMAGIAHFTNYLRYMEEAEHEFLRENGLSVVMYDERGSYGFPKMAVNCKYMRPVKLEKSLDIQLKISTSDEKAIDYDCTFECEGEVVAKGNIKVACCRFPADGSFPFPIPIPDHILSILSGEKVA